MPKPPLDRGGGTPSGVTERLDYLKQEKLQIIRLRHAPEDGVVGGLLADFDLAQLAVGVLGGGAEHLDEQLLGGKVGAAGRSEVAAPGRSFMAR